MSYQVIIYLSVCTLPHALTLSYNPADPMHTYLSLGALSLYPPTESNLRPNDLSWSLAELDTCLNLECESAQWARTNIPTSKL